MKRARADQLLVERGLCQDSEEAKRRIMAGQVRLGADHVVRNGAEMVGLEQPLHVVDACPYVSRGAYKLKAALEKFAPALPGAVCLDIGASTGGFTDLLLQGGAARVYAVDVGHGHLHYRLRLDPRVVVLEKTHGRDLSPELIPEPIDILTVDVSFISVTAVLPACAPLLRRGAWAALLIKPQFEAPRAAVDPGGVVSSESVRQECIRRVRDFVQTQLSWHELGVVTSPIKGAKGNQEYLLVCRV